MTEPIIQAIPDDQPNPPSPVRPSTVPGVFTDPFEAALARTSREFQSVARQVRQSVIARDNAEQAAAALLKPGLSLDERAQTLIDRGLFTQGALAEVKKQLNDGTINYVGLQAQANAIGTGLQTDYDRLWSIDPVASSQLFPQSTDSTRIKLAREVFGVGGVGGSAAAPTYSIQIGPHGEILRMGSNGSFEQIGSRPDLAAKQVHIQTNAMTGEAWALTMDSDGNVTSRSSLGKVAYPEIDPEKKFRWDVLSAAAQTEQAMAGIEIQRRGQVVTALGQDYANQTMLGTMEINEAQLNLQRIDAAFNQQRADREQMLKYAVTESSLRQLPNGQTVTQLPFSDQLSAILSAATGRTFSPSDFQLGVTAVNPDQTARDVIASSSYTDPIPGLTAGLQSTRQAIDKVLAAPVTKGTATQQVLDQAKAAAAPVPAVPGVN